MHFDIDDKQFFYVDIEYPKIEDDMVEIGFDYSIDKYGWGAGGGFYIQRQDIGKIAAGLNKMYKEKLNSFDVECYSPYLYTECNPGLEMHFLLTSVNHYYVKVSFTTDLERIHFETKYSIETLKKDAELWSKYASEYA